MKINPETPLHQENKVVLWGFGCEFFMSILCLGRFSGAKANHCVYDFIFVGISNKSFERNMQLYQKITERGR